ncbi:ABC transporter ATP-binding protein [Limnobacter sp.]|uniref:ABC transporter ATP-binding protein n=1 Tax=Limnobacter sp. TaxID=2003368 RepID=UPI0039C92FE6
MHESILEAKELNTFYGRSHILKGVDFSIKAGEGIALMGRNGMGKTTLLKSLLGIVPFRDGQMSVRGKEINKPVTHQIMKMGIAYVPEGRGIFPNLNVRENLVMAARHGMNGRKDWTFERVMKTFPRLGERISNGGWQLSGGEQQMLTIGRALMTNPDLLILDEATEGLAPLIAQEIWGIVEQVRDTGIAVVIVDKNHRALRKICDRAMIMVKGELVFDGLTSQLKTNPEIIQQHLGV